MNTKIEVNQEGITIKEDTMGYITFKQFIYTLNTRNVWFNNGKEIDDSQTIRIHYGGIRDWFYLGWDDFVTKNEVWHRLETILSPKILNSYIMDIRYNDEWNCLDVSIDNEPTETLEEFNS